jgi:anti-sigma regulatory factor (Ser/Thr protein kinase)
VRAAIGSDAAWELPAVPPSVAAMRHHVAAFAASARVSETMAYAIELAVSELVTNVVLHAYVGREPGRVSVSCQGDAGRITMEVADDGVGVAPRDDSPGVGHGLALVGGLADTLEIAPGAGGRGTVVTLSFADEERPPEASGLEPLCALALEYLADASCLDVVHGGVLRRVTAEVAGDPLLTEWLRHALPPAKPGTATWGALREGGAQLVIHDPTVPRSPGGSGEKLGLEWWVSVPLEGSDGELMALWGLGGREGGHPIPTAGILRALGEAGRTDLAQESQRDALRARISA